MAVSGRQRRIQTFVLVLFGVAVLGTTAFFILNRPLENNNAGASSTNPQILTQRPDIVVEGVTKSVLLNGINFDESCEALLGTELITTNYINPESIEIVMPQNITSNQLQLRCDNGTADYRLRLESGLDELP